MARSGKRSKASGLSLKKRSFETVIHPNEVKVCPDFFKAHFKNFKKQDYGWIIDKLGRNVRITFGGQENENYILSRRKICNELLIQKAIAVRLEYMGGGNMFEMEVLDKKVCRNGLVDVKEELDSDGDWSDDTMCNDDDYTDDCDDYDPSKVAWIMEVTAATARWKKPQAMHFPHRVSKYFIPDQMKEMAIRDIDTRKLYTCRLITSIRNKNEKYLGTLWYQFLKDRKIRKGDELVFCYHDYPYVLSVEVVRG